MRSSTDLRTGVTIGLLAILAVGATMGMASAGAATADDAGPTFEFEDGDSSFGFGFPDGDDPIFDFGDGGDGPTFGFGTNDDEPTFGFGGSEDGPTFDFGDGADGPTFDFGGETGSDDGDTGGSDDDGSGNGTDGGDGQATATFLPTITGTNEPVTAGDALDVTATVENTGAGDGQQTLTLSVGGTVRDDRTVALSAGERRTVTLSWATSAGDAGTYTVTVATANGSDTASVTVENASTGDENDSTDDGAVLPFRPSAFEAYVRGETAYLHSGVNDGSFPIPFTECEDFQPTAAARAANPDYLPLDQCIKLNGTVDEETDTWEGELDFPRITGAIRDTRPVGDVYYAAEIVTTEPVTGTFDLSTGEITGQTSIRLNITVWNVDHVGVPWEERAGAGDGPQLTAATCHIPATELTLSTEKRFEADSPAATSDVMAGQRLNDANETQVVTDDFAAEGAVGCGEKFGVDVNREIDYELGLPAGPGENELVLDFALDLER